MNIDRTTGARIEPRTVTLTVGQYVATLLTALFVGAFIGGVL